MPEDLRFDVYSDLPEAARPPAVALMERIVALQQEWIAGGREEAYSEWKGALVEMNELLAPFREQPIEEGPWTS